MEKEEEKKTTNPQEEIKLLTYNPVTAPGEVLKIDQVQVPIPIEVPKGGSEKRELEWWEEVLLTLFGGQYEPEIKENHKESNDAKTRE